MKFQDDIPPIPIDIFKEHYVVVFDLTVMQDDTENCHCSELVAEALRLEINFTFPLEHFTEVTVLGYECLRWLLTNLVLSQRISKTDNVSLQKKIFVYRAQL